MSYYSEVAAKPTVYAGVRFRSRLEARWAAFFDLTGWEWVYEPVDFKDWTPDFKVKFPCRHSECSGSHEFWAEVKPYWLASEFEGHPVTRNGYGHRYGLDGSIALGADPTVAFAEFAHGAGGGVWEGEGLLSWSGLSTPVSELWKQAGNSVQWFAS